MVRGKKSGYRVQMTEEYFRYWLKDYFYVCKRNDDQTEFRNEWIYLWFWNRVRFYFRRYG